ncbi:rRNA pseudouridine synthase [candidate division KSB1 bacterium]|nr:rRNA pseudouridine synthase [candidate division KSB1 bacterium]
MLDRALSKLGVCSRFEARRAVHEGRVRVNGKAITQHTHWITLGMDRIALDEQPVRTAERSSYLILHKPPGYVTTRQDNLHRPTVFDLLPAEISAPSPRNKNSWLFPVGRLDFESEGLLLFTNDGPLGDALTAPESHVDKVYRVQLERLPTSAELLQLEHGVRLGDFKTLPARITLEATQKHANTREHWLRIAIHEGKNRQVRRMFAAVGCEVRRLIRLSIGPLQLGDLPLGAWRELTASEVQALKKACARNLRERS